MLISERIANNFSVLLTAERLLIDIVYMGVVLGPLWDLRLQERYSYICIIMHPLTTTNTQMLAVDVNT